MAKKSQSNAKDVTMWLLLVIGLIIVLGSHIFLGYLWLTGTRILEGSELWMHWGINLVAGVMIIISKIVERS